MRILITGANGFLGRHLVPRLIAAGHEVSHPSRAMCDLCRPEALDTWEPHHFDRIYHLAAWTQAGTFCDKRRGEQWIINQQINTNVLAWWHRSQPQAKLIALGTSASYSASFPMEEDNYLQGIPHDHYMAYAYAKRAMYIGLSSLQRQFGLRYLHLIPSTLYGPDYPLDGRNLHFIYDLIRKIIVGRTTNAPVILWGNGHQTRELVYIDDFVETLMTLSDTVENETINIGSGTPQSIREFAAQICQLVDFPFEKIEFNTNAFVGIDNKFLKIGKLDSLLPKRKQTSYVEGLRQTVAWWKSAHATA